MRNNVDDAAAKEIQEELKEDEGRKKKRREREERQRDGTSVRYIYIFIYPNTSVPLTIHEARLTYQITHTPYHSITPALHLEIISTR